MKFRQLAVISAAALCLAVGAAHAELIATPLTGDSRLVQFNYDEDNTFLVLAKPKAVTHIQFAADEVLQSVAAGDTSQWELTPTKNRKNLFVKPKYEDLETSMTVITDQRTYQFVLRSTGDGKKWYQRISWLYPKSIVLEADVQIEQVGPAAAPGGPRQPRPLNPAINLGDQSLLTGIAAEGLQPDSLRFNYQIEGDAAFKPLMAFDDGKFTYLKMPPDLQVMPVLFAVIEGQDYALVNYVVKGDYMVAQRLIDTAVLKLGKSEVRITKKKARSGLFGFATGEDR